MSLYHRNANLKKVDIFEFAVNRRYSLIADFFNYMFYIPDIYSQFVYNYIS